MSRASELTPRNGLGVGEGFIQLKWVKTQALNIPSVNTYGHV